MAPTVTCVCCKTDVCNKVDGCVRVIVAWQIATIFSLQRCHIKNIRTKKENATSHKRLLHSLRHCARRVLIIQCSRNLCLEVCFFFFIVIFL